MDLDKGDSVRITATKSAFCGLSGVECGEYPVMGFGKLEIHTKVYTTTNVSMYSTM